ncbi:Phenolic glucoside malonyltransferase 2 [Abeliophyllum distichum]|uniref:Phenolic glucoside malonyltransferase 2 n=1 Tax=Abeliophyllum distichum TaxID=126358 RepID=A0ABD1QKR5_9LAMI
MATQLEHYEILPPPTEVTELILPLTFFDIPWLYFHPVQRLLFYEFTCSKPYFLEIIVPNLKESLTLILKHYIPLASNVLYPSSNEKPVFRYMVGDSVSLTIAESSDDVNNLIANYARDADQFYPFVPQLPPPKEEAEYKTTQSCVYSGDSQLIEAKSLPLFDRSVIKDPRGIADVNWNQLKNFPLQFPSLHLPTNKVRATYILHQADIKKLKDSVSARKPDLVEPSSFVVTTAYVWTCMVKSGPASGEEVDADVLEYFGFVMDCRTRMNPAVPANYFGNCLGAAIVKRKHEELIENEGFFIAAEAIAEIIRIKVNNTEEMMKAAENLLADFAVFMEKRILSVAGSPKFDLYEADYGWGRPKKQESVSIDGYDSFSLCKTRDSVGGLEIGLSLPKNKMDAFSAIFASGLGILSKEVLHSD